MKLRLKAYSPSDSKTCFEYGTIVLKNNIFLKLIEGENIGFLKMKYGEHYFPIKPSIYSVTFLDETNENHKNFKATIRIKDSLLFYSKLNRVQKFKLKWILGTYDIQSKEMKMDFYKYILGGILGIVFTIITQEVNQRYKAEPQTPPKAGSQKSLEHNNLKNIDR